MIVQKIYVHIKILLLYSGNKDTCIITKYISRIFVLTINTAFFKYKISQLYINWKHIIAYITETHIERHQIFRLYT